MLRAKCACKIKPMDYEKGDIFIKLNPDEKSKWLWVVSVRSGIRGFVLGVNFEEIIGFTREKFIDCLKKIETKIILSDAEDVELMSILSEIKQKYELGSEMEENRDTFFGPVSGEILKNAQQLVASVREYTKLSHKMSQATTLLIVQFLFTTDFSYFATLLEVLKRESLFLTTEHLMANPDTKLLEEIFCELLAIIKDDEERNWALSDDDKMTHNLILRLNKLIKDADVMCVRYVLTPDRLMLLTDLFRMEKWLIREVLIEAFTQICYLDPSKYISFLLNTSLPIELAIELSYANYEESERVKTCILFLTMLFSTGDPMPISNDGDVLGPRFVNSAFDGFNHYYANGDYRLSNSFVALLVSYNLHQPTSNNNVLVNVLNERQSEISGYLNEQLLHLVNRGEDPVTTIFQEEHYSRHTTQAKYSVHKLIFDILSHSTCYRLFRSNEVEFLLLVASRELSSLSNSDQRRLFFLNICYLILTTDEDYSENSVSFKDLKSIFDTLVNNDSNGGRNSIEDDLWSQEIDVLKRIGRDVPAFSYLLGII